MLNKINSVRSFTTSISRTKVFLAALILLSATIAIITTVGSAASPSLPWAHLHHRCIASGRIKRSDTWAGESFRSVSQSAGKRDNLTATTDFRRSSAPPQLTSLKKEASAHTISHRDKIWAVAVRCALGQAGVAKMLQSSSSLEGLDLKPARLRYANTAGSHASSCDAVLFA